jgi:O-antigen ligase/tetratricopeptide (TPR) repeat protein
MSSRITLLAESIIFWGYAALFFVTPLIVVPFTSELFEFNKMFFVYAVTIIVVAAWVMKEVWGRVERGFSKKKERQTFFLSKYILNLGILRIRRTPLDIAILLFLVSQILATVFSIDRYVSIWGYYSRQNGGLLSTISYIILYYAFVSNFGKDKLLKGSYRKLEDAKGVVLKLLYFSLASGLIVAVYGIAQHFGVDSNLWVQDVQNRVFSTLGQPNWLAAYLNILTFISLGLGTTFLLNGEKTKKTAAKTQNSKLKTQNYKIKLKNFFLIILLPIIFYLTILYTKSRSGLIGFLSADLIFWLMVLASVKGVYRKLKDNKGEYLKLFIILHLAFLVLTFFVGVPFGRINKFMVPGIIESQKSKVKSQKYVVDRRNRRNQGSIIASGGTESGEIRKYVWQGAINAWRANPILGTGVETFAWAFYKYKPVGHNNTSEWDFLYNKAHNEYLNYAATTGILGLLGYLGIIGSFIWWFFINSKVKSQKSKLQGKSKKFLALNCSFEFCALSFALFSAWVSILVTNFFGFSTVVTSLYFWLVPGMAFTLKKSQAPSIKLQTSTKHQTPNSKLFGIWNLEFGILNKKLLAGATVLVSGYLLFTLGRFWYADVLYARGKKLVRSDFANKGREVLKEAVNLRPGEPVYWDELGYSKALLAVDAFERGEASRASELVEEALDDQGRALKISPQNLNFLKTRVRIYYLFSQMNSEFIRLAIKTLQAGRKLAPNDPKILYNLGLLYSSEAESTPKNSYSLPSATSSRRKSESTGQAQMEQIKTDETDSMVRAIKLIKQALELKPNYRDARVGLGLLYSQEGEVDKARREFEYVLEKINSQDQQAAKYLEEYDK